MNTELREQAKNDFEKDFFMNIFVFGKAVENLRKHRNVNLIIMQKNSFQKTY